MALLFDSWIIELITVLFTLVSGIYIFVKVGFQHWKKKGLPYLEPTFPFGNLTDVVLQRKTVAEVFKDIYWKLDGHKVGGIYQLYKQCILVRDPELIKTVLVKDFVHFHSHGMSVNEDIDPLAAHLFALEGTKWRDLRYKLTPTFTSGKMKMMFPTLVECGKELKAHLAPIARCQGTIEIKDVLARYSADIIATCAFGIESNCLKNPDSEFRKWGQKVFEPSSFGAMREMVLFMMPRVAKFLSIPSISREVTKFFIGIVGETLEYREKFHVVRNDFMQLLINIKNHKTNWDPVAQADKKSEHTFDETAIEQNMYDVKGMTTEEVAAQAFVFFIAGFETSATTMSFCLYELALNQDIQERLRVEIQSALEGSGGEFTYEAIMNNDYLDRVVLETMRKYPPLPQLMRLCTKDYELPESGILVEKGTSLVVPVYALHHDPLYYPNPEEFDPERFTEEAKNNRHHYVYLPFGEGPRICIGSRFGLMQAKVAIASVLSAYQVEPCSKSTLVPLVMEKKSFILTAEGGINLKFTARVEA